MYAAIAAVITGIIGAFTGASAQNNAAAQAQYEQSLQYSQGKEMTFYKAYENETRNLAIIGGLGMLFIILALYIANKKN